MPFLLNEDTALKQKLLGLSVHDASSGASGRPVMVRFKNPEYELADSVYPIILISHTRVSRDSEREARGYVGLGYAPEGYARWSDMSDPSQSPYMSQLPVPVNIDYQVEVYVRKQTHLIELTGALLQFGFLSERFGFLAVPQDGTVRRLDILGGPEYTEGKDELGKRLFGAVWSVRVSSEIFLYPIDSPVPAERVLVDLVDLGDFATGHLVAIDGQLVATAPALSVTTTVLPDAVVGVPYRAQLTAAGASASATWFLPEGYLLPQGLALSPDGWIFGTPGLVTTAATAAFTVGVRDTAVEPHQTATTPLSLVVT